MMGFWGYGQNSHAFYYVRTDERSRIFFRLEYGGIYMDNNANAERIGEFLTRWFKLEAGLAGRVLHLTAVDSMGLGLYEATLPGAGHVRLPVSIFTQPEAWPDIEVYLH